MYIIKTDFTIYFKINNININIINKHETTLLIYVFYGSNFLHIEHLNNSI